MPGPTDAQERAILDDWVTANSPLYLGLSSTIPSDAGGNITEPSGGSYARVEVEAADWAAAAGTTPAVKANDTAITFPSPTADWVAGANLVAWFLSTASSGGTVKWSGRIVTPTPALNGGDPPEFAIGQLQLKAGNPGDPY